MARSMKREKPTKVVSPTGVGRVVVWLLVCLVVQQVGWRGFLSFLEAPILITF